MAKTLSEVLSDFFSKTWAVEKVRCTACGHKWIAIHPKIKGGEYKLQCPKCKKRDSEPVKK